MNEIQDVLQRMEDWGYLPLHKPHPHSPGHRQLLVALRRRPTEKHFDPYEVQLWLRNEHGSAQHTALALDPLLKPSSELKRVCPGYIIIRDRKEKRVAFFTFGGTMNVVFGSGEAVCSFRSPAPIIRVTEPPEDGPSRMAVEVETLMGETRARWGREDAEYLRRLADVEPFQFYLAAVHSMRHHFEDHPALQEEDHELALLLRSEKEWLTASGQWPAKPPTLESLLAPERRE